MKAVIVELKNGYAAALTDDGCIKRIPNKDYAIGQVFEMKARNGKKLAVWAASAAAAVLLCSTTVWAYVSPYTYVSLDVNPSIEFSVNRFGRVLSAKAINDDGTEILTNLSLQHKPIGQAVREAVQQIAKEGYFSGEEPGGVVVATSCPDQNAADNLAGKVKDAIIETTKDAKDAVIVESESVGQERVQQAQELGVTPGKLNLVEKLKAASPDPDSIEINEWLKKPVKDIMKATKECRKNRKQNDGNQGSSEGTSSEIAPGSSKPAAPGSSEDDAKRKHNKDAYNKEQNREKNGTSSNASSKRENSQKEPCSAVSSKSPGGNSDKNKDSNHNESNGNGKTAGNSGGNDNGNSQGKGNIGNKSNR